MSTADAATETYTLSLHDALPIFRSRAFSAIEKSARKGALTYGTSASSRNTTAVAMTKKNSRSRKRSEEHTSELQSLAYLVCRLLLENKKDEVAAALVAASLAAGI